MAFKSEANVQAVVRASTELARIVDEFLDGDFLTQLEVVKTALEAGDDAPEDAEIDRTFRNIPDAAGGFIGSILEHIRAQYAMLGRLAGSPDLSSAARNISEFNSWLIANSKNIRSRGLSFPTGGSATGSGQGTIGVFTEWNTVDIDVSHIEDLTIRCVRGSDEEVTPGREEFVVEGEIAGYAWQEGGSSLGLSYNFPYGDSPDDISAQQNRIVTGGTFSSIAGSQASGNYILNGDFDTPISGTGAAKLPQWNITSGDSNIIQSVTVLNGINSINVAGAAVMKFDLIQRPTNGTILGLAVKAKVNGATGTVVGTITITVRDRAETETYGTLTHVIDTAEVDLGNILVSIPAPVYLPADAAPQLRVIVTFSALTGTATGKSIDVVDVTLGDTVLVDGKAIMIYSGETLSSGNRVGSWKRGDQFVLNTSEAATDVGAIQKFYVNRASGRYLEHDTNASAGWEDS